jgi:hypothetical protein
MNEIFQDLITEGVVSVYLNDILIFTNSLEEHCRITCLVLDHMRGHKLYLWLEKCAFEETKIEYLGVIISHNKVEIDLVKIAGVVDWPMPSIKKGCNPSSALSISTDNLSWASLIMHTHSLT